MSVNLPIYVENNRASSQAIFRKMSLYTIPFHLVMSTLRLFTRVQHMIKHTLRWQQIADYSYFREGVRIGTAIPSILAYQTAAIVGCFDPMKGMRWLQAINRFELSGLPYDPEQVTANMMGLGGGKRLNKSEAQQDTDEKFNIVDQSARINARISQALEINNV